MMFPKPKKHKPIDTSGFAFPKKPRVRSQRTIDKNRKALCEVCGRPAYGEPHHIIPRSLGGPDHKYNLIALCWDCHYVEVANGRLTKEQLFPIVAEREKVSEEMLRRKVAFLMGRNGYE